MMAKRVPKDSPLARFADGSRKCAVGTGVAALLMAMGAGVAAAEVQSAYLDTLSTSSGYSYSSSSYASTRAAEALSNAQAVEGLCVVVAAVLAAVCSIAIAAHVASRLAVAYKETEAEEVEG